MNQRTSSPDLARVIVAPDLPICEAMAQLDAAGTGALLLCEADGKLVGSMTDGDIRRAILRWSANRTLLNDRQPQTAASTDRTRALRPAVYGRGRDQPFAFGRRARRVQALLMRSDLAPEAAAGCRRSSWPAGSARGCFPSRRRPKPLLPVGDRPLLERTIKQMRNAASDIHLGDPLSPRNDHQSPGQR